MSGYYCRDCRAIRPLFVSEERVELAIPRLGTVPFDPELARRCDLGIPFAASGEGPVGGALEQIAQRLLDRLEEASR